MPRTTRAPRQRDPRRGLRAPIPPRALVVSLPFSATLRAERVAAAVATGLRAGRPWNRALPDGETGSFAAALIFGIHGEKEIIEDLIVAAHADARRKAEALLADKMKSLTGGLPLPPGLNLF